MDSFHYVHLSNRTENLYQELKRRLFATSHPFTKRMIIVPSAAMKSWLMLQMAEDPMISIAAGIEVGFVEPSINTLFDILSIDKGFPLNSYEPSELELALALEDILVTTAGSCGSLSALNQKDLQLLFQYLGISGEGTVSKRALKRIRALASTLAMIFRDYGLYGGEVIAEWKHKTELLGWQGVLWEKIEMIFDQWNYPSKKLASFQLNEEIAPQDLQIHLFGLSFLAPVHHRFLQKIAEQLPVYYYLLSPCQKFWGDTLSDKEGMRLKDYWNKQGINQASFENLEDILRDKNPLLANFGRLGREMTVQTESMDALSKESYALPETVFKMAAYSELISDEVLAEEVFLPLTMLEAIQADIALLRSPDVNEKIAFDFYDETIQVHAVPKKIREVQVVYDVLMGIIDKHRDDPFPILPEDIFVMAPNISEYAPFIKSVFESSESQLGVQLMDLQVPSEHLLIKGFLHLLSLSNGRWEASALLQLFDYAGFRDRHRLTKEDVAVIGRWVKDSGIYWGKDHYHRGQIFNRDYYESDFNEESFIGTWEHGLGRLLEGLVMQAADPNSEEENRYSPLDGIEVSQGDLLGRVLHLIRSLQVDLKPLMDGAELTLEEWSSYLKCLFDAYFVVGDEEGDAAGHHILVGHIETFAKASKRLQGSKYRFDSIYRYLEEMLKGETTTYKESCLQAVRFSSLLPMRAVPAKVIVLMGMGDGLFPRMDHTNTLNLLLEHPKVDYYPAKVDFDRYIFLESILSARRYFVISYVSQEPGDAKIQAPSLLVKELLSYLDSSYCVEGQYLEKPSTLCMYHHPLIPFHRGYYSENGRFRSYSNQNYLAALSHYHIEKRLPHTFLSEFLPISVQEGIQDLTIDLKELLDFAKSPLKVYLNQVLGIYLKRETDRTVKDEEDLFLSDLNASILSKQGLFGSKAATLVQAEKVGQLPQGPFKAIGKEKIERDIDQFLENLKESGIEIDDLFSIEFSERYQEPTFLKGIWKVPALDLNVPDVGRVKIIGRIDNVSEKGLIQLYAEDTKKVLELWPACLVLRYLIETYSLKISSQLIFAKGKKVKIRKIDSQSPDVSLRESLMAYLKYYVETRNSLSPFVPSWVPSIFSGDIEELKNVFKEETNEEFQPKFDQYLNWLERNSPHAEVVSSVAHWQMTAKRLFVDIFPKGKMKNVAPVNVERA